MSETSSSSEVPFKVGDLVVDKQDPSRPGRYTGQSKKVGPFVVVELLYLDGTKRRRPLRQLEAINVDQPVESIEDRIVSGRFGKHGDLQRLITFEKLKGTLHDVVYSMEAAQIDFYPYQFKPVLKFINSPSERLILADEVGLGKTIEAALIWMELQARRQANRLLVVCPKILTEKWRDELRSKFQFDARIVDAQNLNEELAELEDHGAGHQFVVIASYTGLRPPKSERHLLNHALDEDDRGSLKTKLLRSVRHWTYTFPPFDLVVFDEAHYMRNPATTTFQLGESLVAHDATAVLCVSATPVHNKNTDLHSLLQLVDRNLFETQSMFDELLSANRPAIQAYNALSRNPVNRVQLQEAVEQMARSWITRDRPLFRRLLRLLEGLDEKDKGGLAEIQETAEKLNLLGGFVNRTRRVQVKENRPVRTPRVLRIEYSQEEMSLYASILELVRRRCLLDDRDFHVFQVLGIQLRAASCLPVIAEEIRLGRLGDINELLSEGLDGTVYDILGDAVGSDRSFDEAEFEDLLNYDFETHDSKFQQLQNLLTSDLPDEKIVIFAYYRPTLAYLRRRLAVIGIPVATIHGGIDHDNRWEELARFREDGGPRVLLSSEVGSEGIDLQFCRVVVNYDLPWNPMRVEQRIGRIDRVGQKAERLTIVNFKVRDTIEERLYDRLHSKLLLSANSMGDLEAVIGEEVRSLTRDLLSKKLTPEEERRRIEQAELAIENNQRHIKILEESGDGLIALSDYVQKKITEDRERGRYLQPVELEDYLADFFEREFPGTELNHNTPADDCFSIRLSAEGHSSLSGYIFGDQSLSARPFRQRQFAITFRREVFANLQSHQRARIHFVNHMSPLIRWMTSRNREHNQGFYNTSALLLKTATLPAGDYCYRIERKTFEGIAKRESMAYGVVSLDPTRDIISGGDSEIIVQELLRRGRDWDHVDCDVTLVSGAYARLEEEMLQRFENEVERFDDENKDSLQTKLKRAADFFDRKIDRTERAIQTMRNAGRSSRAMRLMESKRTRELENKEERLRALSGRGSIDFSQESVAGGLFRVE